jgi:hypothetical protein
MFWVALATLIMMLSGDGDDTTAVAGFLKAVRESAMVRVEDPTRRAQVVSAVDDYQKLFVLHRQKQNELAGCIEQADRNYRATEQSYAACEGAFAAHWTSLRAKLTATRERLEANLLPAEADAMGRDLVSNQDAQAVVSRGEASVSAPPKPRRGRGLQGVAAQRHLTVPRNTLSILVGPGLPITFGQRFAAGSIEAGVNYRRVDAGGAGATDQWIVRGGVVFGLFDDFEAGALFIPIEISPNPHFDDVTVFLTQNFRFKKLDIAARFSFRTPGEVGWGFNPGVALRYRPLSNLALDAAVHLPFEIGSFSDPKQPTLAFSVPLRATWNVTPHAFLLANTGVAYDDLSHVSSAALPLGAGLGYSLLLGKRLIDFTGTFDWEGLVRFSTPSDQDTMNPGSYRVSFGATMHAQAL